MAELILNKSGRPRKGQKVTPNQKLRIEAGLCRWCGAERGSDGTAQLCRKHADRVIGNAKRKRQRRLAAGLCDGCSKPLAQDRRQLHFCEDCVERRNRSRIKREYGLTEEEYERILAAQDGVCAICKGSESWRRLAVDHCHVTKQIRGFLCASCNTGIGFFKDDPILLSNAIEYLTADRRG